MWHTGALVVLYYIDASHVSNIYPLVRAVSCPVLAVKGVTDRDINSGTVRIPVGHRQTHTNTKYPLTQKRTNSHGQDTDKKSLLIGWLDSYPHQSDRERKRERESR